MSEPPVRVVRDLLAVDRVAQTAERVNRVIESRCLRSSYVTPLRLDVAGD